MRKYYHRARDRARQDDSEQNCLIIDGMDQSKTDIPHFAQEDKLTSTLYKLRTHLTGEKIFACTLCSHLSLYVDISVDMHLSVSMAYLKKSSYN